MARRLRAGSPLCPRCENEIDIRAEKGGGRERREGKGTAMVDRVNNSLSPTNTKSDPRDLIIDPRRY